MYAEITHLAAFPPGTVLDLLPNGSTMSVGEGAHLIVPADRESTAVSVAVTAVIQATVEIHNESHELIGPGRLQLVNAGRQEILDASAAPFGFIKPHGSLIVTMVVTNHDHPGQPQLGTTVTFRDASDRWWQRHLAEPIEAIHRDPENWGPTAAQRATYAKTARRLGLTPAAEPRVSLVLKWRRWRRRGRIRRGRW